MHHRGEETDLGTSRSLTRLPLVPRNTVGRGQTEPRTIDSRSLVYVMCYLLFVNMAPCVPRILLVLVVFCYLCYMLLGMCYYYVLRVI